MVCRTISSFFCPRTAPEDADERWLMHEAQDLVRRRQKASEEIDANTAQVGKQCEESPVSVDLKVNIDYLAQRIEELAEIQKIAEQLKGSIETARKVLCCCSCDVFKIEKGVYKALGPVAFCAATTSVGVGIYQYQAGKDGLIWQIIGLSLFIGEKFSAVAKERLKEAIFRHTYTAKVLDLVCIDAEKERKNAASLKLTFEKLPKTLLLTGFERKKILGYVLQAIPEAYRGNFSLERLNNFANRNLTMPASVGRGSVSAHSSGRGGHHTRPPSLDVLALAPLPSLKPPTPTPSPQHAPSAPTPAPDVRLEIRDDSAAQTVVASPPEQLDSASTKIVSGEREDSAATPPPRPRTPEVVQAQNLGGGEKETKSPSNTPEPAPRPQVDIELASVHAAPLSHTPRGAADDFTEIAVATFESPPAPAPPTPAAKKERRNWLEEM